MPEIEVRVWWSGEDGADDYQETIELTDEEYVKLRKFYVYGEDPAETKGLKTLWKEKTKHLIASLRESSKDGYEAMGGKEVLGESFKEWFDNYDYGVDFDGFDDEPIDEFTVLIEDSGETSFELELTDQEVSVLNGLKEIGEDFEELENYDKSLYNKIVKAAKNQIEEDLNLTYDEIDLDEISFAIDY